MGYLRLLFSLLIMAEHLTGFSSAAAGTSMVGFYLLSGYSITARGTGGSFWVSRLMRLWPSYAAIALLTQLVLWVDWESPREPIGSIYGWSGFLQWLMIVPPWWHTSLIPPAWPIKWIMVGYLLMWLGASKTPQRSAVWMIISVGLGAFFLGRGGSAYEYYYWTFLFASLIMSLGACCYHLGLIAPRDGQRSALAGALSYPVFLSHYGISSVMASITGWNPSWSLFWASLPPTIVLSIALVLLVERPIARYRKCIR
jgi:peptidoglycan/LPS O-acetylase OafA/YrhL